MYDNGADFMHGADRAEEYRQPWLLHSLIANTIGDPSRPEGANALLPPLLSLELFRHARERFVQVPLIEQAATFARAALDDYQRRDRSPELYLRGMHSFLVRRDVLRKHADTDELSDMWRSGLLGSTLDRTNRALMVGRIPELIASELARLIADGLAEQLATEGKDAEAADWLVSIVHALPMGDVIGAQALVDAAPAMSGLPLPFINHLLRRRPSVRPVKAGTHAVMWVPEIGQLEMKVRADGAAIIRAPGTGHGIELPADAMSVTYGDLDSWLMLSHLAGVGLGVYSTDEHRVVGLFDPAVLGLVGASPIPLRRVPIDLERSGMHLHDAPGGSSLVCSKEGIIEPVTFSIFRFLDREGHHADEWLQEACEEGSAALLSRVSIALTQRAALNVESPAAKWAADRNASLITPALNKAMRSSSA